MNIGVGDLVQVNAAAFVGSWLRNKESIPCEVLEMEPGRIHVRTQWPYRMFTMWVNNEWIEETENLVKTGSA